MIRVVRAGHHASWQQYPTRLWKRRQAISRGKIVSPLSQRRSSETNSDFPNAKWRMSLVQHRDNHAAADAGGADCATYGRKRPRGS